MIKLKVNDKIYKVDVAITDEEKQEGLQNTEQLDSDEGMLFVYDQPQNVSYWMDQTPIDLDVVFIDENDTVIKVSKAKANTQDAHTAGNCMYVLEVAANSGITVNDQIELDETNDEDDDIKEEELEEIDDEDEQLMSILNRKGNTQMELKGGERIFSRKNTKTLLKFAKRADMTKSTNSYKTLGRKIFSLMDAQDNRDSEYVELPE